MAIFGWIDLVFVMQRKKMCIYNGTLKCELFVRLGEAPVRASIGHPLSFLLTVRFWLHLLKCPRVLLGKESGAREGRRAV